MHRHHLRCTATLAMAALFALPLAGVAATPARVSIGQVQGSGATSPLDGLPVVLTATVSADFSEGLGGVFVQDAGDGDPATSDGLFVRAAEGFRFPESLAPGRQCRFHGRVIEEKRGAGSATTLLAERIDRCRDAAPVPALALEALPADWEALEGMRVRIDAPLAITGTDAVERFGELAVSFDGRQWQPSEVARPGSPEHAEATARNAEAADGALDEIVSAIRTIASMAERIAEATAQQGGAASEIRDRSERIHHLGGDNLTRIGEGRVQGEQLLQLGSQLHTAVQAFRVA